jgi:hypothetical protein
LKNYINKLKILLTKNNRKKNDWDVCTVIQVEPYYDIWALRHVMLSKVYYRTAL